MKKCGYKIKQCPYCGKHFKQNTNSQKYCSIDCQTKANYEKKLERYRQFKAEEQERKLSSLDKKIKKAHENGLAYKDLQKAETVEKFARVRI